VLLLTVCVVTCIQMSNIDVFDLEGSSPCAEYLHVLFGKVLCSELELWISNFSIRCLNTYNTYIQYYTTK